MPGHQTKLWPGVQLLVEAPLLPGLVHLLRLEATAAQLGLGEVPCSGHAVLTVVRIIESDVSDHLRLDSVDNLLSEDVGKHSTHYQDHEEEEDEDNVGEEETLDLFVTS